MFGIRIGCEQRQRCQVVAGYPGGALGVEHIRPVAHPQRKALTLDKSDVQYGVPENRLTLVHTQFENGLEQWFDETQLTLKITDWKILVRQQLRLGTSAL